MELWYRTVRSMTLHSSDLGNVGWMWLKLYFHDKSMEIKQSLAVSQKCCSYARNTEDRFQ